MTSATPAATRVATSLRAISRFLRVLGSGNSTAESCHQSSAMGPACASAIAGVARAKSALAWPEDEAETGTVNYRQICPLSLASEVFAERWTPLIIREIVLYDRHHFSEIQHAVGPISQSLLSSRLQSLVDAGILERRPNRTGRGSEYHATQAGREFEPVLTELAVWAQHWIELRREHCDPPYLMQTLMTVLRPDRLPPGPLIVRFAFETDPRLFWLVIDGGEAELCFYDPGRDVDLFVSVEEQDFGAVLLGRMHIGDAILRGGVRLDGPVELVRAFPSWLGVSPYARYIGDSAVVGRPAMVAVG